MNCVTVFRGIPPGRSGYCAPREGPGPPFFVGRRDVNFNARGTGPCRQLAGPGPVPPAPGPYTPGNLVCW